MTTVNIEEAQADLTRLIDQASNGEPIIITRAGKPLVKVQAVDPVPVPLPVDTSKRFGFLAGQFTIPDDFDTYMQDEIIEMFEGDLDKFSAIPASTPTGKPR